MPSIEWWEWPLRLALAVVFGGIVGYQREAVDRPAGLRTHILVCLGSTLMMLLSAYAFAGADPTRIAAQVVTGIGFLGAGTIIRQGSAVRGLTTAASIWAVAGVGLAVGAGSYLAATLTAGLVFGVLTAGKRVERQFIPKTAYRNLLVRAMDRPGQLGKLDKVIVHAGAVIRQVSLQEEDGEEVTVRLELRLPPEVDPDWLKNRVAEVEGVSEVAWSD